jgi:hypothetical protein
MLDRLILLKDGRVMYQGREDDVVDYFAARSHVLPPKYNPADFIMTIAQTVPEEDLVILDYYPTEEDSGVADCKEGRSSIESTHSKSLAPVKHVSGWVETGCLVKRDMKSIKRNKMIVGARMMLTTFMSLVIGLIFQDVGQKDSAQPVVRPSNLFLWCKSYCLTCVNFLNRMFNPISALLSWSPCLQCFRPRCPHCWFSLTKDPSSSENMQRITIAYLAIL